MKPNYILIILLALLANVSKAQIITTVAGGDTSFLGNGDGGPATNVQIAGGGIVRTDGLGNIYMSDGGVIRKIDAAGIITTIAGGGTITPLADGQKARDVLLNNIKSMAVDSTGNVFITIDSSGIPLRKVIKINTAGIISIVAGNGTVSYNGDGSVATFTGIAPTAIAVDALGNLYIANGVSVLKVNASGIITTVAGIGSPGYTGDGGQATAARLDYVDRLTTDKFGNLFIHHFTSDLSIIRKVNSNGIISTLTKTNVFAEGLFNDFGTDNFGNLYISGSGNKIQRMTPQGTISTVAGTGARGFLGDGGPATAAEFDGLRSIAVDNASNIYVTDLTSRRLRKIDASNIISTIAGTGVYRFSGDDGQATKAALGSLNNLASDRFGNLYIADQQNHVIRKVNPAGIISTVAGNKTAGFSGDGGLAINARLNSPNNVSIDSIGNIYIFDARNYRIRKLDQSGIITTIAGNGIPGNSGEGGLATSAQIDPRQIAVSKGGTVYFTQDVTIRKVGTDGIISRVAGRRGSGTQGYSGDGGPAINATLNRPSGIYVDNADNVFINDYQNARIRKISKGTITTVAGNGTYGYAGDGGQATAASLSLGESSGITTDLFGNLFIADYRNSVIRQVDKSGIITTVAGNGTPGYSGDGGKATSAQLLNPAGLAADPLGNLYITQNATLQNAVIRYVNFARSLPLNIISFNGQLNNKTVLLKWQTANEINTKDYIVQRSSNGSNFSDAGKVKSINVAGANSYSFTDLNPLQTINYYRLKIEDNDGRFTYSNILPVKLSNLNKAITFYPNPAKNLGSILFYSNATSKYSINITDATGRLINHVKGVSTIGANSISIDVSNFSRGTYTVSVINGVARQSIKFNKQ